MQAIVCLQSTLLHAFVIFVCMTFIRLSHAVRHESLSLFHPLLCTCNVQLNFGVLIDKL